MDAGVVLEYLKVILSTPVLSVLAILTFVIMFRTDLKALMARIAKVKFPGGEIETSQLEKIKEESLPEGKLPEPTTKQGTTGDHPAALPDGNNVTAVLAAERAKATLWEYRYL